MTQRSAWRLGGLVLLSLTAGCGDDRAATTETFKAALQAAHDSEPVCVPLRPTPPVDIPVSGPDRHRAAMDALVSAGLLAATPVTKDNPRFGGPAMTPHRRYRVTPAGAAAIRPSADRFVGGSDLCFARRRILEVSPASPEEIGGVTLARVTYTWALDDVAPWAQDPAVQAALPRLARTLGETQGQSIETLVRAEQGWRLDRSAR